jgi:UTP--glucose-1-phosphate uridylyltransferase
MISPVKIAVIPAAGLGTRFAPATKVMPKEMLTVGEKPLIQLAVEEALASGIEKIILVISPGKEILVKHFEENIELTQTLEKNNKTKILHKVNQSTLPQGIIEFVYQEKPLGLGHAVLCAREKVGDQPFAVILPDDTVFHEQSCLSQMMDLYKQVGGNVIASCEVPLTESNKYGMFKISNKMGSYFQANGLVEKPSADKSPSNFCVFGRYIIQPEIFKYLEERQIGTGGEIQLTDALSKLMIDQSFYGYLFKGRRLDCGSKLGFVQANIAYAIRDPEIAGLMLNYLTSFVHRPSSNQIATKGTDDVEGLKKVS